MSMMALVVILIFLTLISEIFLVIVRWVILWFLIFLWLVITVIVIQVCLILELLPREACIIDVWGESVSSEV